MGLWILGSTLLSPLCKLWMGLAAIGWVMALSRTYEFDSRGRVKCHVSGVYHVTAPRLDPDYDVDTYDVIMTSQTVLVLMTSR